MWLTAFGLQQNNKYQKLVSKKLWEKLWRGRTTDKSDHNSWPRACCIHVSYISLKPTWSDGSRIKSYITAYRHDIINILTYIRNYWKLKTDITFIWILSFNYDHVLFNICLRYIPILFSMHNEHFLSPNASVLLSWLKSRRIACVSIKELWFTHQAYTCCLYFS